MPITQRATAQSLAADKRGTSDELVALFSPVRTLTFFHFSLLPKMYMGNQLCLVARMALHFLTWTASNSGIYPLRELQYASCVRSRICLTIPV